MCLTEEQIKIAVDKALEKHKAIPFFYAVSIVMAEVIELYHPESHTDAANQVDSYLVKELDAKRLIYKKGRGGGICKPQNTTTSNQIVINDHICPSCGNDRCSKSERSCWKCGGAL